MPRYDTILFDLDGTILYTLPDIAASLNHALTLYDRPVQPIEAVRSFIGNGTRRLVARALPKGEEDEVFSAVCEEHARYYAAHWQDETRPYPGIEALFAELKRRGIALGVVTNKTHSDACAMIRSLFGTTVDITIGKKDGCRPKPAPDAVDAAIKELHTARERTLYVGDSEVDFQTAQNAGMDCVLVSWGYRDRDILEKLPAPALIDAPEELLKYL